MRFLYLCILLLILAAAVFGYMYCQDAPPSALLALIANAFSEETALPLRPYVFTPVIDPGHGGIDAGAVSDAGTAEAGINLDISLKTDLLLRFLGIKTTLTRDSDVSIHDPSAKSIAEIKRSDLKNRVKLVNETPNAVLISIHQNKFSQSRYYGAQCFHNGAERSKQLAEAMQEQLRLLLDKENKRQVKQPDGTVYLLAHSTAPSVLVECGFLSNPEEEVLLQDKSYQTKIALGICSGFLSFAKGSMTTS